MRIGTGIKFHGIYYSTSNSSSMSSGGNARHNIGLLSFPRGTQSNVSYVELVELTGSYGPEKERNDVTARRKRPGGGSILSGSHSGLAPVYAW